MKAYSIKYYPVGNGDTSLISINENGKLEQTILIDCNIRVSAEGEDDKSKFDVKADLLSSIKKRDGNPFVDVFILTHGDQDHCRGFKANFYQGDPKKYSKQNRENDEIIIDEIWFSPMIAEESTNDHEDAIQQEAERRLDLHCAGHADKDLPGNRILIIGYDGNKDYKDLNHLRHIPGSIITKVNHVEHDKFSVFIHAPYKQQLTEEEKDKNHTSIVFQARFKTSASSSEYKCLAFFAGDADHHSVKIIMDKTKSHGNDTKESALDWDLFLSPHHCSWSFFNDRPHADNPEPTKEPLAFLDYQREGAFIIASCNKILDEKPNPPHYAAMEEYVKKVPKARFIELAITPTEKEPKPVVFTITDDGIKRTDDGVKLNNLRNVAAGISNKTLETSSSATIVPKAENTISHKDHRFHS